MTALVKQEKKELQKPENSALELSIIEQVVVQGDLSKLNPEQRVVYYKKVCESAGLNPFTRPFEYILLNGKLTLYAKKDCTEQLRKINGISIEGLDDKIIDDLYIVKARAKTKDGRTDESTGAVTIGNLRGDAKANAIMKAETKAKRRVTLSISGLGWVDESEIESIPSAEKVSINIETGEIKNEEPVKPLYITSSQAKELQALISECEPEKQSKIWAFMEKKCNGDLSKFPLECFENTKKIVLERRAEYMAKLNPAPTSMDELVEDEDE